MIDAHLHLWDPRRLSYDWLKHVPSIAGRHGPEEWARQQAEPRQAVFVQADCAPEQTLNEVDWVSGLDRSPLQILGVVAFAPLEEGEAVRTLLRQLKQRPLVCGVRRSVQNEAPGFISSAAHIEGLVASAEEGLSLDLCARDHQLPELIEALDALFAAAPHARVVLDHLGKPDIAVGQGDIRHSDWAANLEHLAKRPQVFAKLSGLTTQDDWAEGRDEALRPYIDHALACFGPSRLMYGGDWPVAELARGGLSRWRTLFDIATARLSNAERALIRHETARGFYRLPPA